MFAITDLGGIRVLTYQVIIYCSEMQEGYKFQFSKAELNVFYLGNVVFILTKSDQLRFMPGMYVHFSAQKSTDDL